MIIMFKRKAKMGDKVYFNKDCSGQPYRDKGVIQIGEIPITTEHFIRCSEDRKGHYYIRKTGEFKVKYFSSLFNKLKSRCLKSLAV